jgi:uncharacterized protein (TIGR02996 family)
VTSEDDFQRQLDAQPDDWQTRLVFADWLDERGDPRAEGYRALGILRRVPQRRSEAWGPKMRWVYFWDGEERWFENVGAEGYAHVLPRCWVSVDKHGHAGGGGYDLFRDSRRATEDAAALAFSRLPADRRAELLSAPALT